MTTDDEWHEIAASGNGLASTTSLNRRQRSAAGSYYAGMRFAIAIPQDYADGSFSPGDFRSYFARVEELGVYESAWAQEGPLGRVAAAGAA